MEAEAKKRIADLMGVFERNPDDARDALRELFPDKLMFTAIETPEALASRSKEKPSSAGSSPSRAGFLM